MTVAFADEGLVLHAGDCLDVLATLDSDSIDSVVTDPPYGIGFMGHAWDQAGAFGAHRAGPRVEPGHPRERNGHVTYPTSMEAGRYDPGHRASVTFQAWCEAWGRETLRVARPGAWLLAFGSPRLHHRLAIGLEDAGWELTDEIAWMFAQGMPKGRTTLKPAHEPIVMARKLAKRVTPLQIDETRIGVGRWPANVVLTDPVLDGGYPGVMGGGQTKGGGLNHVLRRGATTGQGMGYGSSSPEHASMVGYDDAGTYSRYFLIPKAGRRERNAGVDDLEERPLLWSSGTQSPGTFQSAGTHRAARNHHPTVKPLELMEHLVRLVTPRGGAVLDPFIGSGTTAVAAIASGRTCIGIDRDPQYLQIAIRRLRLLRRGAMPAEVPA